MLPLTQRNVTTSSGQDWIRVQEGWRQRRPIDRNLTYLTNGCKVVRRIGTGTGWANFHPNWDCAGGLGKLAFYTADARNRSYESFRGKLGDRAEWLVNLAELNKSIQMVTDRSLQIARFLRRLRGWDFVGAAAALKVPVPKKVSTKRAFADNYLEYHYGWSPLIKDIYTSVDILQQPIKDAFVQASAKNRLVHKDTSSGIVAGDFAVICKHQSLFAVSNPNLFLANQLGLINPLLVVWETIPFSFVVDWFVNVSTFCGQGTDMMGLSLKMSCTSQFVTGAGYKYFSQNQQVWAVQWRLARDASILGPGGLVIRSQRLWHWRRMAAAASLVVSRLVR